MELWMIDDHNACACIYIYIWHTSMQIDQRAWHDRGLTHQRSSYRHTWLKHMLGSMLMWMALDAHTVFMWRASQGLKLQLRLSTYSQSQPNMPWGTMVYTIYMCIISQLASQLLAKLRCDIHDAVRVRRELEIEKEDWRKINIDRIKTWQGLLQYVATSAKTLDFRGCSFSLVTN